VQEPPPQPAYAAPPAQSEPYVQHPQFQQMAQPAPVEAPPSLPPIPQQLPTETYPQQIPTPVAAPPAPELAAVAAVPPQPAHPKDEFEVVMDSLMKEFEEEAPAPAPVQTALPFVGQTTPVEMADSVPELPSATTLLELCDRSGAESSEDYLLLSAYYLTFFEREEKFSLKRINSMLVKSGLTPVNHSVLEATLGRSYLSMVPDMTGLAEVSEYVLTMEGQQAAKQLI
jgi:hypothetical protein